MVTPDHDCASLSILEELCNAHGVSGYEDDVRAVVESYVRPLMQDVQADALGNLIARKPAINPDSPTLLLDAHMDEVGLVISYIEPSGFLRFATVGGWDERVLPAHAVDVRTQDGVRIRGVIGIPPPHIQKLEDKNRPYTLESLFIDVGAESREEATEMGIAVGDSAVPYYPFSQQPNGSVIAKALDDRAGCTVLIRTLQNLFGPGNIAKDGLPDLNVVALFSTFEEIGARGAQAGAYAVNPDIAMILEGTVAGDFPGVPPARCPSRQGAGPAITLMDRTSHSPRRLVKFLQDVADTHGIPHQLKTPIFGGTNAARIHMVRGGVPSVVVSVPCRYIHSPHATLRVEDLEAAISLSTAFVQECRKYPGLMIT